VREDIWPSQSRRDRPLDCRLLRAIIFPKEIRKTAGFPAATKGEENAIWQKIIAFDRDKTP